MRVQQRAGELEKRERPSGRRGQRGRIAPAKDTEHELERKVRERLLLGRHGVGCLGTIVGRPRKVIGGGEWER